MSLSKPHPLWKTCGDNSFEVSKAIIQAKFLSGRYRTDKLLGHFNKTDGVCCLCSSGAPGTLEHLILLCPSLEHCRQNQFEGLKHNRISDISRDLIISTYKTSVPNFMQLLLDCSSYPPVIQASQEYGNNILNELFKSLY